MTILKVRSLIGLQSRCQQGSFLLELLGGNPFFSFSSFWKPLAFFNVCVCVCVCVFSCSVMSYYFWPHGMQPARLLLSMEFFMQELLEWVAISTSTGSFWPRDWTCVSHRQVDPLHCCHLGSPFFDLWLLTSNLCFSHIVHVKVLVSQLCPTLCNPIDCSPAGSLVHGIYQARILEPVAIPFSMVSSWPRNRTWVLCIAGRFFIIWATSSITLSYFTLSLLPPSKRTLVMILGMST